MQTEQTPAEKGDSLLSMQLPCEKISWGVVDCDTSQLSLLLHWASENHVHPER